ncbi:MAG TPA: response regulator transcription factor [Tepidisphaeraceae bacterium]|jgi:DNA-binding NarL/FixJ family response regulator|nr:response regulator transcription factor [Tepidisphaeraceae bacterium]
MSIRIVLADDHQIVREGLRALVAAQDGMDVVGEASNGRSAVELSIEMSPDVVVMDIGMPDLNGIEATRRILSENPRCKVIGLSMHSDRRFLSEMLKAGATAYLLKDSAFEELASAIRAVVAGQVYLSPRIADAVVEGYLHGTGGGRQPSAFAVLTSREREVLQLVAEGQATKQIAASLHVSVKTVETHRRQIMEKLNLHSVAELTKYAIREGLASIEV